MLARNTKDIGPYRGIRSRRGFQVAARDDRKKQIRFHLYAFCRVFEGDSKCLLKDNNGNDICQDPLVPVQELVDHRLAKVCKHCGCARLGSKKSCSDICWPHEYIPLSEIRKRRPSKFHRCRECYCWYLSAERSTDVTGFCSRICRHHGIRHTMKLKKFSERLCESGNTIYDREICTYERKFDDLFSRLREQRITFIQILEEMLYIHSKLCLLESRRSPSTKTVEEIFGKVTRNSIIRASAMEEIIGRRLPKMLPYYQYILDRIRNDYLPCEFNG
jgi:hypothetical protein